MFGFFTYDENKLNSLVVKILLKVGSWRFCQSQTSLVSSDPSGWKYWSKHQCGIFNEFSGL